PNALFMLCFSRIFPLLVLPLLAAFAVGTGAGMKALGAVHVPGAIAFPIAFILGVAVAYGAARLIVWLVQKVGSGDFAAWHGIAIQRWNARMRDHRLVMVGAGLATLLLSVALFGTLPLSFFPPQNDDFARVNVTLAPGTTMKQTEAVIDNVARIGGRDPDVERTFERIDVGTGHVSIVLKKSRKMTSDE